MKVPLSWLHEYLDTDLPPETLAEALTLAGIEVEGIEGDILEISLTPNLGHCLSIYGIARELSAILELPLKRAPVAVQEAGAPIDTEIRVQLIDQRQCPRYACRLVRGVRVGPSPAALKNRIEACGLHSINNVVDVGTYVKLALGQPIHLFDLDTIAERTLRITSQTEFQEMRTLDGVLRPIPPEVLVLCDPQKPLCFAGVIGADNCPVTERTTDVFIEAAYYTPQAIRKTSKLLGFKSDASYRCERGTDPNGLVDALNWTAALLSQYAGGTTAPGILDHAAHVFAPRKIACRPARVNHLLGIELSMSEMTALLRRLEMTIVEETAHQFVVLVPTYRNDIKEEIDLIEEIIRIYGYNLLPRVRPRHVTSPLPAHPSYVIERRAREQLIGLGLQEMLTCDLIHPDQAKLTAESAMDASCLLSVLHPSSIDQSVLRASLLPGLLQVVKHNCDHGNFDIAGFEVGRIHFKCADQIAEPSTVGIVLTGAALPYHFDDAHRPFDFFDLKGIVQNLLEGLGVKAFALHVSHLHNFHPGRQARVTVGDSAIGVVGEVHPAHLLAWDIPQKVYYAELNLNEVRLPQRQAVVPLPQFPGSERDWTVTLKEETPVGWVMEQIRAVPSHLLETISLLDLYKSEQIGKDKKNATFRFFYRDLQKTIAYETVEQEHARILEAFAEHLKG